MAVSDYYLLDWIYNTSTQYINPNYTPNSNTTITSKCYVPTANGFSLYSQLDGGTDGGPRLFQTTSLYAGFGGSRVEQSTVFTSSTTLYTVVHNTSVLKINGTSYSNGTGTDFHALKIMNGYSTSASSGNCKLCSMLIAESGVAKRDFVAAKRKSDNVLGLYDLANDTFYTNAGSGTFTAGSTQTSILTINKASAGGTCTGDGSIIQNPDGLIRSTLTATPNTGYKFTGWYDKEDNLLSSSTSYDYVGEGGDIWARFVQPSVFIKKDSTWKDIDYIATKVDSNWNII